MNFVEGIIYFNSPDYPSFHQRILEGGPLYVLFHVLFVASVPLALVVILRGRTLSWSLLASIAPFSMAALACHISSLGSFGFMEPPGVEDMRIYLIHDVRFFWIATITSVTLALLSFRVRRMNAIISVFLVSVFLTGCSACQRPIQLCPRACRPVVDLNPDTSKPVSRAWFAYSKQLADQEVYYWLTDSAGRPVTSYRYKHDRGIFESDVWPLPTTTKESPQQISMPIILKHGVSDVLIHLGRAGQEQTISLHEATLEHHPIKHHKHYDVIYID